MKQQIRWAAPNSFRQDQVLPFGTIVAYTDGNSGWLSTPQGIMPMNPQVLKQAQGEVFRELVLLMLSDHAATRTVTAIGPNSVQISSGAESVRVDFDDATGLPAHEIYQQMGMGGMQDVTETLSDWREVDGIKLPFKITMEQAGKKVGDVAVSEIKINTGIKPEDLSKRPEPKK